MDRVEDSDALRAATIQRTQAELAAAVSETEAGIFRILDSVSQIMAFLDIHSKNPPTAEVRNQCTSILEACSFQDIVGQRLVKIGRLLASIAPASATDIPGASRVVELRPAADPSGDAPLDGPALAGEGLSQEDVERLFNAPASS